MTPFDFIQLADHVTPKPIAQWAPDIAGEALKTGLSPLLIAAVMQQESGGRDPKVVGFDGHGRGLMQIDDRYHPTFCAARFDGKQGPLLCELPWASIAYGAALLRKNLLFFGGDLWPAVAAYNAGPITVRRAIDRAGGHVLSPGARIAAADAVTHRGEYIARVRGHFDTFTAAAAKLADNRKRFPSV